ncbi:MAG: tetratricopeptide repeat protein [Alteromonadaceae bacterium]|nr:tetratricopeptide repeat protein [Alteromonadaceae bacterium]
MLELLKSKKWLIIVFVLFGGYLPITVADETVESLQERLSRIPVETANRIPVLAELVKACWRKCAGDAKTYGEEALQLLKNYPNTSHETLLLMYLPRIYMRDGQHDYAKSLIEQGLIAATEHGDPRKLASIQFNQAVLFSDLKKFILAENAYRRLYKTYAEINHANGMASALNNLGRIYRRMHNYAEALEKYQEALEIYRVGEVVHNYANTLANVGEIYMIKQDYNMARQSTQAALDAIAPDQYPGIYINIMRKMANIYVATEQYADALELLLGSLNYSQNYKIRTADPATYATLVRISLLRKEYQQAEQYYKLAQESADVQSTADFYPELRYVGAEYYLAIGEVDKASQLLEYVEKEIKDGDISDTNLRSLKKLIEATSYQGLWQRSTELLMLYNQKLEELAERDRNSRLEQYEIIYKASEKERQIALLEKENHVQSIAVLHERSARHQVVFISVLVSITLFVAIYVGIQRRKVLKIQTELMKVEAEKKRRLFSDISHELRTPLSVLKLQIEGLEYELVDDPKQTYKLLQNKVASINHLISDISHLAQADAGDLELSFEPVYLLQFFQQWYDECQSFPEEKGLRFNVKLDLSDEDKCIMDPERITQVLNNLLLNSCRYTDAPGEVEFKIRVRRGQLQWLIRDSAPGLKEEQLELIFERLYRADKSRSRKSGGSGLGLTICKSFVEAHGGSILARSSDLGGLEIEVNIPISGVK